MRLQAFKLLQGLKACSSPPGVRTEEGSWTRAEMIMSALPDHQAQLAKTNADEVSQSFHFAETYSQKRLFTKQSMSSVMLSSVKASGGRRRNSYLQDVRLKENLQLFISVCSSVLMTHHCRLSHTCF